ncbi:MAG: AzlD domain-containing protein [Acidimicrobiia bacterium]|nr:AzlD domain-containing protein [Acidimicrobiia bacterium]
MSTGAALTIVLGVALTTYSMRASVIVALADRTMPAIVERALGNVGPAVLAALTVSLAAGSADGGAASLAFAEAAALIAAAGVAWWRKNMIHTLAGGMLTLLVLAAIF